jgi:hypothetical protein
MNQNLTLAMISDAERDAIIDDLDAGLTKIEPFSHALSLDDCQRLAKIITADLTVLG